MGKNILIFSDGTGKRGGVLFEERRSNIYKLYRATRCGPDSSVDPSEQLAFYDAGIGTLPGGITGIGRFGRWLYNLIGQATGLGLTDRKDHAEGSQRCDSTRIGLRAGPPRGRAALRCNGAVPSAGSKRARRIPTSMHRGKRRAPMMNCVSDPNYCAGYDICHTGTTRNQCAIVFPKGPDIEENQRP
ncbi:MAG: DUF2235 domain-containing protein [Rhodospirillales bacterium]|nr:DUF2235 domain-containing protein [Rhodospirillales bacterium]